ncbi:MAG: SUMF1/EgtB/PvdO family nonheme iron enzyme [Myxococcota bacterium]
MESPLFVATDALELPFELVDQYGRCVQFVEVIGEGGFGRVYRARIQGGDDVWTTVAIKALKPAISSGADALRRLRDEARILAEVHHPVVLAIRELLVFDGQLALVTEFIEGVDLRQALDDPSDPLPLLAVVEVVGHVADALATMAAPPIRGVHRDIKPANIRIGVHGSVKLLDFGIAKSSELDRWAATRAGWVVGTLQYLAPERLTQGPARPPSDVFALGLILAEALYGRSMSDGHSQQGWQVALSSEDAWQALIRERLEGAIPSETPEALPGLIEALLAYQPSERPSAADLAVACEQLARAASSEQTLKHWCRRRSGEPAPSNETMWITPPPRDAPPRRAWWGGVVATLVVGLLLLGGLAILPRESPPVPRPAVEVPPPRPPPPPVVVAPPPPKPAPRPAPPPAPVLAPVDAVAGVVEPEPAETTIPERTPWTSPCGNGTRDPGEACDFGEADNDGRPGGCTELCSLPVVWTRKGTHTIGSPPDEGGHAPNEGLPRDVVFTEGFRMLAAEVTLAQRRGFGPRVEGDGKPWTSLSWSQARAWCNASGMRLPSEVEWEVAARGGTSTAWSCGSQDSCLQRHAWSSDNATDVQPVATKRPNPFGLFDMHGNVWEWVEDCHVSGRWAAVEDAKTVVRKPNCSRRVIRGGSVDDWPFRLRSATRRREAPQARHENLGFRCVR